MTTSYSHLTLPQRHRIEALKAAGAKSVAIARSIGVSPSTICRELSRGRAATGTCGYQALPAERIGRVRRQQAAAGRCKLGTDTTSPRWRTVMHDLRAGWSPEQIAGRLRRMADTNPQSPERQALCVSHETIYCAIYATPRGALRTELIGMLRQSHKKRMPRARGAARSNALKEMTNISLRPVHVAARIVAGHWEGDLIKGAMNRSQVGTIIERTSRYVMLVELAACDATTVLEGFTRRMKSIPAELRRTLTYDQGREMAHHKTLAKNLKIDIFFCDPHSPWQRGSNENANGLLREFMPKGIDLGQFSRQQLTAFEHALNHRPRKILGYETPHEVFSRLKLDGPQNVALQV